MSIFIEKYKSMILFPFTYSNKYIILYLKFKKNFINIFFASNTILEIKYLHKANIFLQLPVLFLYYLNFNINLEIFLLNNIMIKGHSTKKSYLEGTRRKKSEPQGYPAKYPKVWYTRRICPYLRGTRRKIRKFFI